MTIPRPRPSPDQFTAGTPGDGYLVPPADHVCEPGPVDPGERPRCRHCQREPERTHR